MYIGASELSLILPANVSIGTNTQPLTLGEVASVIVEVSAELDSAAAAAGYAVPVSTAATSAYAQMQRWCKQGAGAAVLGIIFPNLGGPGARSSLADDYRTAYRDALKALRKGEMPLIGASPGAAGEGRELPRSYSTSNPTATAGVLPTLDLDSVF